MTQFIRVTPLVRVFKDGKPRWEEMTPTLINPQHIVSITLSNPVAQIKMRGRQTFYVPCSQLASLVEDQNGTHTA